ncbi:MAG: cyclase family protein [Hyphomicrobiaceae bacterium]|nr:MAG: cyclase family protein [Hyphomicrobiaceae bacterium]
MTRRWKQRPEGSNWGEFGDDDQLGSLNHITPDRVRAAVGEVCEGLSFCLSLPLDYPGGRALAPHRFPPVIKATERGGKPYFNYSFRNEGAHFRDIGCDDAVTLCTQYSTQWDSFAHIGHEFDVDGEGKPELCFYNGYVAGRDILPPEERADGFSMPLGIDAFAARPIQGRGVLIDVAHHLGRDRRTIGFPEIATILQGDGVRIEKGDIVCLHTGFADELLKMGRSPDPQRLHNMCAALDGTDRALLDWISASGIAAIAADNYAVERIGEPSLAHAHAFVPLHYHCLFKRGVPLGELWHLTELAQWLRSRRRTAFLLTAPPLRLPGAVGSPVTPVATV